MRPRWTKRLLSVYLLVVILGSAMVLPACSWDGHFTAIGYTTRPNYDTDIKTVRVPIFANRTYMTVTPVVGMEMDLTRAVVREIELKTPYKVVNDNADTELKGTIVGFTKSMLNYTPFNTVREAETVLVVELVWKNIRTGQVLTRPSGLKNNAALDGQEPVLTTADSLLPQGTRPVVASTPTRSDLGAAPSARGEDEPGVPVPRERTPTVTVRSVAHFRPELGESITTALQRNYDRMAVQIVSVMEKPW